MQTAGPKEGTWIISGHPVFNTPADYILCECTVEETPLKIWLQRRRNGPPRYSHSSWHWQKLSFPLSSLAKRVETFTTQVNKSPKC